MRRIRLTRNRTILSSVALVLMSILLIAIVPSRVIHSQTGSHKSDVSGEPSYPNPSSPLREYQARLKPEIRNKIADDLAMVLPENRSETLLEKSISDDSLNEERLPVIVQTLGRPARELIASISTDSSEKSVRAPRPKPHRFSTIDGFVATLTPSEIEQVASRPDVTYISPDRKTRAL